MTQRYIHLSPATLDSAIRLVDSRAAPSARRQIVGTEDGANADPGWLYVVEAWNDVGLAEPTEGTCFTLAGAEAVLASGMAGRVSDARAETAANAVTLHVQPGLRLDRHGPEAVYLQAGTMVDVVGDRLGDIDPEGVRLVPAAHPRPGFTGDLVPPWPHDCPLVPGGRPDPLPDRRQAVTQRNPAAPERLFTPEGSGAAMESTS